MAPEQCASSREVTGRADIYSLGAVLFRCLIGRPPFTGTTTQILHAHVYSSLSLPDDLLASLPSELVDVLRRSLAKTPQERFAFAKDMADDLTAISDSILSQENSLAEQTSTLTLVSLPSVQLPPSLPHTTDTVIIPGPESRLERSAAQDIPPEPPKVQGSQHAKSTVSKRSSGRLIVTILGSVLVLALLAIGPAARNALQGNESSATTVSPPSDAAAPPSLSADESQPVPDDSVESLATADNTASVPVETQPEATSEPPAALEVEAANACQYQAAEQFESFLGEDESVAQELGCPKGVPTGLAYEIQVFQTGMALGRLDKPIVYIRYFSNDEWEQREHDWREGLLEANDSPNLQSPTEELFQPVRGIGQIWAEGLFVRQALGWAITQPKETNGVLQSFEGGLLIYNSESQDPHIFLKSQLRL
jgi:serine/threonine-protein kinase